MGIPGIATTGVPTTDIGITGMVRGTVIGMVGTATPIIGGRTRTAMAGVIGNEAQACNGLRVLNGAGQIAIYGRPPNRRDRR